MSLPYVALATTTNCVSSAQWYVPYQLLALRQWSMPSFRAGLTTATRYLLASPIACFVDYSRSRMRPPVLLPALLDVNTSRRYSGNFIGYQYVSAFGTSWQTWHSDHYQARRRRVCRRLPARCWIRTAVTKISGTIRLHHTTPQQHCRWHIIRSSRSACVERPSCYPSQHRADNVHFLQKSQNCFVYCFMRSRRIRDIFILLRRL